MADLLRSSLEFSSTSDAKCVCCEELFKRSPMVPLSGAGKKISKKARAIYKKTGAGSSGEPPAPGFGPVGVRGISYLLLFARDGRTGTGSVDFHPLPAPTSGRSQFDQRQVPASFRPLMNRIGIRCTRLCSKTVPASWRSGAGERRFPWYTPS